MLTRSLFIIFIVYGTMTVNTASVMMTQLS